MRLEPMTVVAVKEDIAADADAVWKILGNFAGVRVAGPITAFDIQGEGVGAVRTISMGDARIVERLETFDPDNLTFSYVIVNADSPLPVTNYVSVLKISPNGDAGCTVEWTGTFEPRDVPESQAEAVINGIYTGNIAAARRALVG